MTPVTASHIVLLAMLVLPAAAKAQQSTASTATSDQGLPARIEQRLARLHSELGITPSEEMSWRQYAQVTRANAQELSQSLVQRRATLSSMTAEDNLRSLSDMAAQHARNMQRLLVAFQQLYNAMPPDQRGNADQVLRTHSQPTSRN